MPLTRSTEPPVPSRPGNARDGFACAYRHTRNRKSSSGSWDGGLVEGSWTEGYFSTGQMACADLIGESLVDGAFDDLMALVQLGMPIQPKMVAGRNYWDEMGGGDFSKVHTAMFKESSNYMREVLSGLGVSVEKPTLECLMNGNMLLMWALRREYNARLIGAIGLVEGSAPVRFRATTEGLERLKQPERVIAYHKAHIDIDTHHSRAWLEVVLDHYASCGDDVVREMALGVSIRHNIALRYYHHMYGQMRVLGDD